MQLFPLEEQQKDSRQSLTLTECYRKFHAEHVPTDSTRQQYEIALRHWSSHTDDPPVSQITQEMAEQWQSAMLKTGLAPSTCDKTWRALKAVLRRIGPLYGSPRALGVIERVPYLENLDKPSNRDIPRIPSTEDWSRLYRGCVASPDPLAWQTTIVLLFSLGPRHNDLVSLEPSNIHLNPQCPMPGWESRTHEHGWCHFRAGKTGKHQVIPLTSPARQHIDRLRERDGDQQFVLPIGGPCQAAEKRRNLILSVINDAAGISPKYTCHPMRKGANVAWELAHPGAGKWLLGHSANGVNEQYYMVGIPILLRAVGQLEIPEAFQSEDWHEQQ